MSALLMDQGSMLLFARRRAFAGIRTRDPAAAVEAFDALSTIDSNRIDYRDLSTPAWRAGLAADRAGFSLATAAAGAISRATGSLPGMLSNVVAREGTDLEKANRIRGVDTTAGPVLLGDDRDSYQPDRDLWPSWPYGRRGDRD